MYHHYILPAFIRKKKEELAEKNPELNQDLLKVYVEDVMWLCFRPNEDKRVRKPHPIEVLESNLLFGINARKIHVKRCGNSRLMKEYIF